jgi:prevent-host-death family protein
MKTIDVEEAQANLAVLLGEVERGEDVVIARDGKPIARLTRVTPIKRRQPGMLRALPGWRDFEFDPSVFAPMTDEECAVEGWPL